MYASKIMWLKRLSWDDINFRFYFCNEVVYPTDHDFIFFQSFYIKKKIINIYMNPLKTQQTFCIPKHLLKDG